MKHTEEQILKIAHKVMKDLRGNYYFEDCVDGIAFKNRNVNYGKYEGKKMAQWIVGIKSLFDNEDLLLISDEDGEPLYYQNFNTFVNEIDKDERGYYRVGLPRD
jgi:hypothetical protein